MREVLTACAIIAEQAWPGLAGRVAVRRRASSVRLTDGPHAAVTLPDVTPSLAGDGGRPIEQLLRLQLSVWQTIDGEDPELLPTLHAAYAAAPRWRWLGSTELVEQPGDVLQTAVALGYAQPVGPIS